MHTEPHNGGRKKSDCQCTEQWHSDVCERREFRQLQKDNVGGIERLVHDQLRGTFDPYYAQKIWRRQLFVDHYARDDGYSARSRRNESRAYTIHN